MKFKHAFLKVLKYFSFCVMLFALVKGAYCKQDSFIVEYETPQMKMAVTAERVFVTEREYTYDNPVSATPSSVKIATNSFVPDKKMIKFLEKLIIKKRFFSLKSAYGSPDNERYYGYSIMVKHNGKKKKVVYRSNPAYPGAPESFKAIEKALIELKKSGR